jgi:hypothetical protein
MTRAWLIFVSVSVLTAAFVASLKGLSSSEGLSVPISVFALLVGAAVSGFVSSEFWTESLGGFWNSLSRPSRVFFVAVFVLSASSFLFLTNETMGQWGTANPNNLGDLPLHFHFIEFFARGAHFPPADPTFAGESLHYPYGVDLWDALWVKLGIPVRTALVITGVISLLVSMIALWETGGIVLLCAFFFSGGLAMSLHWEHTFGPTAALPWKNLFHSIFVTQRGFLWALPAGLFLIRHWQKFLERERRSLSFVFLWIWSVMPFFHLHSFVVLSFWMGLTILAHRRFSWRLFPFALLALFFIFRSVNTQNVDSALSWSWGWMFQSSRDVILNLGAWAVLPPFLLAVWIKNRDWKSAVVAVVLTFFAVNLKLAPWIWDQIKVLVWVYLLWTLWIVQQIKMKEAGAAALAALLFWPGAMQWASGWPSWTGRFEIQNAADRAEVRKLLEGLSPDEIVAAKVEYHHPLFGLGQSLVMGLPGQAWSHGFPMKERTEGLESVLSGRPGGNIFAKEFGVKWMLWKENGDLNDSPPLETWKRLGWSEEKKVGAWHLWKFDEN